MSLSEIFASCAYYIASAVIAFFVALCFDFLKSEPPENYKKLLEAVVCGFMSFAICGYSSSHFEWLSQLDCLFLGVGIGVLGAGRVSELALQVVSKKFNITVGSSNEKD